ncbi:hypothetical protein GCM10017673_38480 [Streptosporangium violaceochromogenes]|nr:hypothetical protein GCM10017673_38480 [Streptosporangium violaceochromogenes]
MNSRRHTMEPIADGEAVVLLTFEREEDVIAELLTARHPSPDDPLRVPAGRIAEQAGLPVVELAGRRFAVESLTDGDADGFRLLDDPRL